MANDERHRQDARIAELEEDLEELRNENRRLESENHRLQNQLTQSRAARWSG